MKIIEKITAENGNTMRATDTGYGQWLLDNHSEKWNRIADVKGYLESEGFVVGKDSLPQGVFDILRGIHEIMFQDCRVSREAFIATVAAYIKTLDEPGIPIVSMSHYTLNHLYTRFGTAKVDRELARQFEERKA